MTTTAIPDWPNPESPEAITFFGNAGAIVAAWRARGVPEAFALGMLANAEAESSLDPNARGDHVNGEPTAFGLHQWHKGRVEDIRQGCGIDIEASSLSQQVDAAWWELQHYPYLGLREIQAQKTAYMAAYVACILFEHAGAANAADRRGMMAERWSAYFGEKAS